MKGCLHQYKDQLTFHQSFMGIIASFTELQSETERLQIPQHKFEHKFKKKLS